MNSTVWFEAARKGKKAIKCDTHHVWNLKQRIGKLLMWDIFMNLYPWKNAIRNNYMKYKQELLPIWEKSI